MHARALRTVAISGAVWALVGCGGVLVIDPAGQACGPDEPQGTCPAGQECVSGVCTRVVGASCSNGVQDVGESDVDCGGACDPCAVDRTCRGDGDCASGVCNAQVCVAVGCSDGRLGGDESDVDCGGSCPTACDTGALCVEDLDCASRRCEGGLCAPPSCIDLVVNQGETDVDCGGSSCAPCADGEGCSVGSDCVSGKCAFQVCAVATCTDVITNGLETDTDCGGPRCAACADGQVCAVREDCASLSCVSDVCAAPTCVDGVRNGGEADQDCGSVCVSSGGVACANGGDCVSNADCVSNVCQLGTCRPPACRNFTQDGDETSVDCGGSLCGPCQAGGGCVVATDCVSRVCTSNQCVLESCTDGVHNGTETDVDCGGGCTGGATPSLCDVGEGCETGADCGTAACSGGRCVAGTCSNGTLDGDETGVDCGGSCPGCATNTPCFGDLDCDSRVCIAGLCAGASCSDGRQNGFETAVDCGGSQCGPCDPGDACLGDDDCASGVCAAGVCQLPSCNDGRLNGSETGVDCGGPNVACRRCGNGVSCQAGGDCTSGVCTGNVCQVTGCSDGIENGLETDVDCGGPSCQGCADGLACNVGGDCAGGVCTSSVCRTPLVLSEIITESANRVQGILAAGEGSGFNDTAGAESVSLYLTLSAECDPAMSTAACVAATTEGTSRLTLQACVTTVNCAASPSLKCFSSDASGTRLAIFACPGAVSQLTQGFYDVHVVTPPAPAAATAEDRVDRAILFTERPAPTVADVDPASAYSGSPTDGLISDATVDILGTGFQSTPLVELININDPRRVFASSQVQLASATHITAVVPAETGAMPVGAYWVRVVNPDGQSAYWEVSGAESTTRGLFFVKDVPGPRVSQLTPARPAQGDFPMTFAGSNPLRITGESFVAPVQSGLSATPGTGAVASLLFSDGLECPLPTLGLSCDAFTQACRTVTAGQALQYLAVEIDNPCGRGVSADSILPVKVTNPDGQFYVYYSLQVYPNSAGHLSGWITTGQSLVRPRAFMAGTVGFDDLRSAYLYVGGGVTCTGDCPQTPTTWDSEAPDVLSSVEVSRVTPFGALSPWAELRTVRGDDSAGARVVNGFETPRAGLELLRVGRWYFAIGGRSSTADGAAALASVERARILGLESRPGIQWARRFEDGELPHGLYHYQVSAIGSEGEGLSTREVSVLLDGSGSVTVQWEAYEDPYGDGATPTSYLVFRSTETIGRPNTAQRLAFLYRPAPVACLRPDGSATDTIGCVRFVDNGVDGWVVTPTLLAGAPLAGSGPAAGAHGYRLSAYVSSPAHVAAAGSTLSASLSGTQSFRLSWEHNGAADGYFVYRDGVCVGNVSAGATTPGAILQFTDTGGGAVSCPGGASPVTRDGPLPRGSLSKWRTLPTAQQLLTPREGHKGLSLSLPVPSGGTRHFLYVVGGRAAAPTTSGTSYLRSTERVEVNEATGGFVQVADYGSPVRYWDYERPTLSQPGDCNAGSPTNCIAMGTARAYHSLTTTYGRYENEQPDTPTEDPCALPDRDGDGFNSPQCGGQDCNDADADIYPGAPEVCDDLVDSNCDGCDETAGPAACCDCSEPSFADQDNDGFVSQACCFALDRVCSPDSADAAVNFALRACDCDDTDVTVFPGATEICGNGKVEDCAERCDTQGTNCGAASPSCDTATTGQLTCAACDSAAECAYDCASGDPTCSSGTCDAATLAGMDQDDDGHASSAYAQVGHPLRGCCTGFGIICDDCNDSRADVHPGAVDRCGNGVDENCDGTDPTCSTCVDADLDSYFDIACGGTDCNDANAGINPGRRGDTPFGALCGNGIDEDCDGVDPFCASGITLPATREPLFVLAHAGVASWSTREEAGTAAGSTESVIIETEDAARLGHFVWEAACTSTDAGKVYKPGTCGVRGWELDEISSLDDTYGQETLTYYDYAFVHGGAIVSNNNLLSNPPRYPMCIVPASFDADCLASAASAWDMDAHLVCVNDNGCTQSTNANMSTSRAFFVAERIFSYIFAIGGATPAGSKWQSAGSVERTGQ